MLRLPDRVIGFVVGIKTDKELKDPRAFGSGAEEFAASVELKKIYSHHIIEIDSDEKKRAVYLKTVKLLSGDMIHIFTVLTDNSLGKSFVPFTLNPQSQWAVVGRMHVETFERRAQVHKLNRRVDDLMKSLQPR